jgi:hypothetical protein
MCAFFAADREKPGFPLQVLGFADANPVGFPLQSLAPHGLSIELFRNLSFRTRFPGKKEHLPPCAANAADLGENRGVCC